MISPQGGSSKRPPASLRRMFFDQTFAESLANSTSVSHPGSQEKRWPAYPERKKTTRIWVTIQGLRTLCQEKPEQCQCAQKSIEIGRGIPVDNPPGGLLITSWNEQSTRVLDTAQLSDQDHSADRKVRLGGWTSGPAGHVLPVLQISRDAPRQPDNQTAFRFV